MTDYSYILNFYHFDRGALQKYGFKQQNDIYIYYQDLDESFRIIFKVNEKIFTFTVLDKDTGDEYTLLKVAQARGDFKLKLKSKIDLLIDDIITSCFVEERIRDKIFAYVKNKYQHLPKYPWVKSPTSATICKNNGKWYALIMEMPYNYFGISKTGTTDIINLRTSPERVKELVDYQQVFPGYHMNKKYWYTVILDNNFDLAVLFKLIDESYQAVK